MCVASALLTEPTLSPVLGICLINVAFVNQLPTCSTTGPSKGGFIFLILKIIQEWHIGYTNITSQSMAWLHILSFFFFNFTMNYTFSYFCLQLESWGLKISVFICKHAICSRSSSTLGSTWLHCALSKGTLMSQLLSSFPWIWIPWTTISLGKKTFLKGYIKHSHQGVDSGVLVFIFHMIFLGKLSQNSPLSSEGCTYPMEHFLQFTLWLDLMFSGRISVEELAQNLG